MVHEWFGAAYNLGMLHPSTDTANPQLGSWYVIRSRTHYDHVVQKILDLPELHGDFGFSGGPPVSYPCLAWFQIDPYDSETISSYEVYLPECQALVAYMERQGPLPMTQY